MAILQDRQGFLWLGTEGGLDRYDGYEVRRYIYDRNRPDELPSSWASTLAEDASGTLWIGTEGAVSSAAMPPPPSSSPCKAPIKSPL
jgi:ligand-binding sensor domain-containing protein